MERQGHGEADETRHKEAEGDADPAELDRLADVRRLDEAIVDAELQAEATSMMKRRPKKNTSPRSDSSPLFSKLT